MEILDEIKKIGSISLSPFADFTIEEYIHTGKAEQKAEQLRSINGVEKVEVAAPGYINITLANETYTGLMDSVIKDLHYGNNRSEEGKTWVIEHTSPNPNKAMHIGHLRTNLIGMSIANLLEASGAVVICDAVDNNRGIAIAKMMYGYLMHMCKSQATPSIEYWLTHKDEWLTPEEKGMRPDVFVSACYEKGAADFANAEDREKIRSLVVEWENKNADVWELWRHVLEYSYAGMNRTLKRLNNRWDKVWHEHEHYEQGKKYIEEGLERGIFTLLPDGAVLTNFPDLPNTIVRKSDGTSLYITQDIALTKLKKDTYKADRLVWVIGSEQTLALKQMFYVCMQLGIGTLDDFTHISYEFLGIKVNGAFKKMSSRDGSVVLIDDFIDEIKEKVGDEKVALAAVKFSMLKPKRNQQITFDLEESTQTSGDSGVYVLYTYVRARSILKKASRINVGDVPLARKLMNTIAFFPDVIMRSKNELSVHHVAQYVLKLCSDFNDWYAIEHVLDGNNEPAKLAVVQATAIVIKNACGLLGIETVEAM